MLDLNIPKILPDELGIAYLEHVASGNALTTDELLSRLNNARPRSRRPSKVQLISEISGLIVQDYVCSHTCRPFYGAFETMTKWCHPHGNHERPAGRNSTVKPHRIGCYFCTQCASEDINVWGRSYWRRSHQIVGVLWCSKHETPLSLGTWDLLSIQPHEAIYASNACTSLPFPTSGSIPARYQNLVSSILDFRSPILLSDLVCLLKPKMRKEGYSCWTLEYGQCYLSDMVVSTCSHQWCHDLFPNFQDKTLGEHFRDIDTIEIQKNDKTVTYLLGLAVLYDDPDEAASLLSSLLNSKSDLLNGIEAITVNGDPLTTKTPKDMLN